MTIVPPESCTTMAEIRTAIDDIDRRVIELLAARMRYIEAAARVKTDREAVRDEWRKADVLSKVAATADKEGFPAELATQLYDALVEYSIAHEFMRFDAKS